MNPVDRLVSKNIEAWGLELLEEFSHSQDAEHQLTRTRPEYSICFVERHLQGVSALLDGDQRRYDLEVMAFGAANRFYETQVQNFFVSPFSPIVLEEPLASPKAIWTLAEEVNVRLVSSGLDPIGDEAGAASDTEFFSRFVIDQHGLTLIFDRYFVAAYASGKQHAHFMFDELSEIFAPEKFEALIPPDS